MAAAAPRSQTCAFSPELEDCHCRHCDAVAAANNGARQLRAKIVGDLPSASRPESDTPAAPTAGVSAPSNRYQSETAP